MKINYRPPIKNTATDNGKATKATQPGAEKTTGNPTTLTAGEIVKGRVLGLLDGGKALLDIGGKTVTARTMVPLETGSDLFLEVKEGGTTPWLALAGRKGVAQEIVRLLFTEGANVTKASASLTENSEPPVASKTASAISGLINNIQQAVGKQLPADSPIIRQLSETFTQLATELENNRSLLPGLKMMTSLLETLQGIHTQQADGKAESPLPTALRQALSDLQQQISSGTTENRAEPEKLIKLLDLIQATNKQTPETARQLADLLNNKSLGNDLKTVAKMLADLQQAATQPAKTPQTLPLLEIFSNLQQETKQIITGQTEAADKLIKQIIPLLEGFKSLQQGEQTNIADKFAKLLATTQPTDKQPTPDVQLVKQLTEILKQHAQNSVDNRPLLPELKTIIKFIDGLQQLLTQQTAAESNKTALPAALLNALSNLQHQIGDNAIGAQPEPHKLSQLLNILRPDSGEITEKTTVHKQITETIKQLAAHFGKDHSSATEMKSMAKLIDAHQQLNSAQPGNQPNFLLFPCFFAGESGWGEWMFQMEEKEQGGTKQITCSIDFFLQMSRLGDVHLKVLMQKEGIQGDFFVGEKEAQSHLSEALPQLTSVFEAYGYKPVTLTVHQSNENLLHSFKTSLEEKTAQRSFALVDVTA